MATRERLPLTRCLGCTARGRNVTAKSRQGRSVRVSRLQATRPRPCGNTDWAGPPVGRRPILPSPQHHVGVDVLLPALLHELLGDIHGGHRPRFSGLSTEFGHRVRGALDDRDAGNLTVARGLHPPRTQRIRLWRRAEERVAFSCLHSRAWEHDLVVVLILITSNYE